ncbi:hypothetical protein HDU84_004900 [Entophlyctis sp. JEL0112]|nr:hypothetical protein HDU84_004900 [Entophlyctis sp. JEL0112]
MDLQQMIREIRIQLVISDSGGSDTMADNFDKVSYTVKTVLQTGKEYAFTTCLKEFIAKKQDEIEKMCNFHYQEFVQSVEQLLKVRLETTDLKAKIINLNSEMQEAGSKIVETKKEIIDYRRILLNIEIAIESVQTCLVVLDVASKINSHVEKGKYYPALRLLDDMQANQLPKIIQYDFSKEMEQFVPTQRENIRKAIVKDLYDWLAIVNEKTRLVGKAALASSENRDKVEAERRASQNSPASLDFLANDSMEVFDAAYEHINFKPLYKCIHIHDVLGKRNKFIDQFESHRETQANLLFQSNFVLNSDDLTGFEMYVNDNAGFFIVEAVVMSSTHQFRSRTNVEFLWETSSSKLNKIITEGLQNCMNPEAFFAIKQKMSSFVQTLQKYGFAVDQLRALILSLFDRHIELTKSACCEQIMETIDEDNCNTLTIQDARDYEIIMSALKFEQRLVDMKFPRILPFSKTVPDTCYLIKTYMHGFYRFADGFNQNRNEMDDLLKQSLEGILINTVGASLSRKLNESDIISCAQILINSEFLQLYINELEQIFTEKK